MSHPTSRDTDLCMGRCGDLVFQSLPDHSPHRNAPGLMRFTAPCVPLFRRLPEGPGRRVSEVKVARGALTGTGVLEPVGPSEREM